MFDLRGRETGSVSAATALTSKSPSTHNRHRLLSTTHPSDVSRFQSRVVAAARPETDARRRRTAHASSVVTWLVYPFTKDIGRMSSLRLLSPPSLLPCRPCQTLPTLFLLLFSGFLLLSDFQSTKAFSFHNRSSLNFAYFPNTAAPPAAAAAAAAAQQQRAAALQRGCVGRHLANTNEMPFSGSDSYALLFLFIPQNNLRKFGLNHLHLVQNFVPRTVSK